MKNKIYLLALLGGALALGACSSEDEPIFEDSAAERLEAGRRTFFNDLCANGGTWAMEYFANYEEPGYVFVMQFLPDNSVTISANHMWINKQFSQERSLWDVISDDGNVLTFNTYNTLFHVFSTPENIVGPNAPTNDITGDDINELGYGHNGDYEFMLMENEGQTIRLLGKKRGLTAYLRQLPADTDPEEYLSKVAALRDQFDAKFPTLTMTETATGASYDVSNMAFGVPKVVPTASTSPNSRTVEGAAIITLDGLRFMNPLEVIREDNSTWKISEMAWTDDGALQSADARIEAQRADLSLANGRYSWTLDPESMSPELAEAYQKASDAIVAAKGKKFALGKIELSYKDNSGKPAFTIVNRAGSRVCYDYCTLATAPGEATLEINGTNKASSDMNKDVPEFVEYKKLLVGKFAVKNIAPMNPREIVFTGVDNPGVSFNIAVN